MKDRYKLYDIEQIGYVDIEATNLKAEVGHILSICNVVRDTRYKKAVDVRVYRISKEEMDSALRKGEMNPDKRIIEEFFEDTLDCQYLVGHWFNGYKRFDMPFLRTRAFLMNIDNKIPNYGYWRFGDTWRLGSKTINALNNKLDRYGHILGASKEKSHLSGQQWWLAAHGIKKGMDYVVDHNIKDCHITMDVHMKLERFNTISMGYV